MNYFAHGRDEIDNPERLAGTALPDWLSAANRGARLRRARLDDSDLAAGVRRHIDDDRWFHASEAFLRTSAELTGMIACERAWFWGHVLTEMLLDRFLIQRNPQRLDDYYAALDDLDLVAIEARVRPWLTRPAARLGEYVDAFLHHRFLYGYDDDNGLTQRLHGLGRRVGLDATGIGAILPDASNLVESRVDDLMSAPC